MLKALLIAAIVGLGIHRARLLPAVLIILSVSAAEGAYYAWHQHLHSKAAVLAFGGIVTAGELAYLVGLAVLLFRPHEPP